MSSYFAAWNKKEVTPLIAIAAVCFVSLHVLQPRISITDSDAIAYILGSYSIQAGHGYVSLIGAPLNHWPPGYSLILALFSDPRQAALWINQLSFGLTVALLYLMLRRREWTWYAALGFAGAIGFGFFQSMVRFAKPDMLTFFLFFAGALLIESSRPRLHFAGYLLWTLLIVVKLIALVFIPAAAVCIWWFNRKRLNLTWRYLAVGLGIWLIGAAAVVLFNQLTIGQVIPSSHDLPTLHGLIGDVIQFATSVPREFITYWYGSLQSVKVLIPYLTTLLLGVSCLLLLRPRQFDILGYIGIGIFLCSWLLLLVRQFDATPRLMGYGVLLVVMQFRPRRVGWLWPVYGAAVLALALFNYATTNALGLNDPRYEQLAQTVNLPLPSDAKLFTNASNLLDVQRRIPTYPIEALPLAVTSNDYFLQVKMPNYDAIMQPISPVNLPQQAWCELSSTDTTTLFQRCKK